MKKDPNEVKDFKQDWGSKRLQDGETLLSSLWIVPDGITKDSDTHDDTTATIWLSGGELSKRYALTNRVTTSGGRTYDDTIHIDVRDA